MFQDEYGQLAHLGIFGAAGRMGVTRQKLLHV